MTRRLRTVVLVLLALAACGGDDGEETVAGDDVVSDGLTAVEVDFDRPLVAGQPVTWRVTAVVEGVAVPVTFPSGQRAEVRLLDGEREVYRWSSDLFFTQAIVEETLDPGRTIHDLEEPSLDVPPGEYELVAELTGEPAPEPAHRSVTVEAS